MARTPDGQPRKRFSKSGHTSHAPRNPPAAAGGPGPTTRPLPPEPRYPEPRYQEPQHQEPRYQEPRYQEPQYQRPQYEQPPDPYGTPTYHHVAPGVAAPPTPTGTTGPTGTTKGRPAVAVSKAAVVGTNKAARAVTRKVIAASKADGADASGLTALIWNQVLSYGTDAMITVALAGTVFFGASTHAQRGNVLLYLLITMAPFAVVAPVIGPALDRLQHGRRWTMAGTAIGRAILALVMAGHPTDLLVLYPCALGSLVLSKAYGVVRAAAAPRLVPPGMTLVEANARLSIFGLGSTLVLGGFIGVVIKITGSYTFGLIVTAIGFAACAFFGFKLPKQVDSAADAPRHPQEPPRPKSQPRVPPLSRIRGWAKRGFDDHLVIALQGESVLRFVSGGLTIFLAFYVESTQHGLSAAVQLGGVVFAAGFGNFLGTAIGTRIRLARPDLVIIGAVAAAAVACIATAILFSIVAAIICMLISAAANSLSKIALDALIQRDVVETLRSSAFARSETFLQLAWVLGAAAGVLLPTSDGGGIAFWVIGAVTGAVAVLVFLRNRAMSKATSGRQWPEAPGSVAGDPRSP